MAVPNIGRRIESAVSVAPEVSQPPPTIEIDGVAVVYVTRDGGRLTALQDVSFGAGQGDFVSIIGPSGCGKSTLLRLVAGLQRPSVGTVSVEGRRVTKPSGDVGMIFQKPVLLPWRTVIDNVLLPVHLRRLSDQAHRRRALELLELVGLSEFASSYPNELSGGMQQRAAIARALITDPHQLLMDEPFGALDALTRDQMSVELLKIWEHAHPTVLFVTHSIPEAVFLSDRIVVMSARPGRVLEVVDVEMRRPRQLAIVREPEFGLIVDHLRSLLHIG